MRAHAIVLLLTWILLCSQSLLVVSALSAAPRGVVGAAVRARHASAGELEQFDAFMFDCDGVLWRGSERIPGSLEAVELIRKRKKRVLFVTNNSVKSRAEYCAKFAALGFTVEQHEVVTSGSVMAAYLREKHPDVHTVYAIGAPGLISELRAVGLRVVDSSLTAGAGTGVDVSRSASAMDVHEFETVVHNGLYDDVKAVCVGWDTAFNFQKLCKASLYIQKGALFVCTNMDHADRVGGFLMPGTGPIAAALHTATGVPPIVTGKPSAILLAYIWKQFGDIAPQRTVFVGDRLDTDVVFANKAGMPSCLVLTGCSSLKDVEESGVAVPTFVAQSLGDFVGVHNAN